MAVRTDPRTKWDSEFEIAYGAAMASIHCRAFRRMQRWIGVFNIFLGGSTFATALTGHPRVAALAGLSTAFLSAFDLFFKPGETADAHERDREKFFRLQGRTAALTMERLDTELNKIRATAESTFDVLARPVYNEVCRSLACGGELTLTRRERFARWLA